MRAIIGLGNPGTQYARTRHNVGFWVIDALVKKTNAQRGTTKFPALVHETHLGDTKVLLVQPQTFMNDSGKAVGPLSRFFGITGEDLLIVYDDVDLQLGELRRRDAGSAGGHKGMSSIIVALGTEDIPRLRIGIGSNRDAGLSSEAYVLQQFEKEEVVVIEKSIDEAAAVILGQETAAE